MDELKKIISHADDDYLTGLCNKGTVKRAYKDLEQEDLSVAWSGAQAEVKLKEETCTIRLPLGESSCSCPSRSICRHTITAILWLKQEIEKELQGETKESAAKETKEDSQKNDVEQGPGLFTELLELPADRLKKACKGRRYQQFLDHVRTGELPPLKESSVVTVTLPWEKATVKLLEPFAYSTCTCKSRELCPHKAQAVLLYQLLKGKIRKEDLEELGDKEHIWEAAEVQKVCESVIESVVHQMGTGLSRQSFEVTKSLERLAVIVHRTELAALESPLREAASGYRQYFSRSAVFQREQLLRKLLWIYRRASSLSLAGSQDEIRALAGTFRDVYEPVGRLHLVGMGARTFSSGTGYEGEIYYFLEPDKGQWYTWTDARPVFYEGVKRRPYSASGLAPWGLPCNREQLQNLEFELHHGKAAAGGRLSVSKESRGEVLGTRSFLMEGVKAQISWDYEKLLLEQFGGTMQSGRMTKNRASGRRERLALVGAVRWGEALFDPVEQRFSWCLYDQQERPLFLSLKYKKEERLTIQLLERLEQRLKKHPREIMVFFGALYLDEEGRMCLYPIEVFLDEAECAAEKADETVQQVHSDSRSNPSRKILWSMKQYLKEVEEQMSDLFVSGLYSAGEDQEEQTARLSEDGECLGLHGAGKELADMSRCLGEKRHRMDFSLTPILEAAGRLDVYLQACQEKLSCDLALCAMREAQET